MIPYILYEMPDDVKERLVWVVCGPATDQGGPSSMGIKTLFHRLGFNPVDGLKRASSGSGRRELELLFYFWVKTKS